MMKRTIRLVNGEQGKGVGGENILLCTCLVNGGFLVLSENFYSVIQSVSKVCQDDSEAIQLKGCVYNNNNSEGIQLKGCVYKSPNKNIEIV